MSESTIPIEELSGGLRAAFVNLPHFRTHSARLLINSGSLHETPDTAGAAHFLEHVTFQGTEGLPTEEDVYRYTEENGLVRNGLTYQHITTYTADGYELETVGYFVSQVAFAPLLGKSALEKERKPIIEELRGYRSTPHFAPYQAHEVAKIGEWFARPIGGSIEDVIKLSHEHLTDYHARNYSLGNAVLVICSSEPIEKQREYAESLVTEISTAEQGEPTPLDMPRFNPNGQTSSLQLIDLPLSAQTSVGISYEAPETTSVDEMFCYNLIAMALTKAANRKLRSELVICYGARANRRTMSNLNFGSNRNAAYLDVEVDLNGQDAVLALDALMDDVILADLAEDNIEALRRSLRHNADHRMQNNPSQVADEVANILSFDRREEVDLEEVKVFADSITSRELRQRHKDITDKQPLVYATSPDAEVLESVGEWAVSRI